MSSLVKRLDATSTDFSNQLSQLLAWDATTDNAVRTTVSDILADVKKRGDQAVVDYTVKFDARTLAEIGEVFVGKAQLKLARERIDADQLQALENAAERITEYHRHQVQESWSYTDNTGTLLGQKVTPLDAVGVYAPGGKAAYPSSILMAVIPAKVAGVKRVVLVTPTPGGDVSDIVLAAADVAGVEQVITIGGAQAVAAMAYGTASIPKVDKIVGPGNIFVAEAKRQVFGAVDIDMIAGPSEILIVADGTAPPEWVAMDLFSQAEHDEQAQAILISPDEDYLNAVEAELAKLLPTLSREAIARQSLRERGALIHVSSMAQAIDLVNQIAPEHLELSVASPENYLDDIRHAGAIFMGVYTSESLGDYCAGPNHVLPTSGTARFSSPLGVYDYVKRSSIIQCSAESASQLGKTASVLARGESLEAHARSAEYRIKK